MRSLRFLHQTDSGSLLVLESADTAEHFALTVDDALRAALHLQAPVDSVVGPAEPEPEPEPETATAEPETATAGPHGPHGAAAPEPGPAHEVASLTGEAPIGPREIQVRVRGGETPADLAAANGMTLERVLRFAAPVVAERLRIADESRRARARRSTAEAGVVVFGEAVDERFAAHGIAPSAVSWDSYRREDGEWIVVASWLGGDGRHTAEWVFTRSSRSVQPVDETAVDLLSDRPIRPVAPPTPEPTQLRIAPPLVPGIVAFPPMPDAHTGPVPHVDEVFDQEAASPDAPRAVPPLRTARSEAGTASVATATATATATASVATVRVSAPDHHVPADARFGDYVEAPARVWSPTNDAVNEAVDDAHDVAVDTLGSAFAPTPLEDFDALPLPLGIPAPAERTGVHGVGALHNLSSRREESEDDRAARARIPSWDDIVLGVRRTTD